MSSTSAATDRRLRRVWRKKIEPAAAAMRERGVEHLQEGLHGDAESWYVSVDPSTPNFTELESADMAEALADLWSRQGLPELAATSRDIVRLAKHLAAGRQETAEVSSDVYAMY